jgi:hypothetical protein
VEATAARMAAAAAAAPLSSAAPPDAGLDVPALISIGGFLAASGYRPRPEWTAQFEGALASALAASEGGAPRLGPQDLAAALSALAAWSCKAGGSLAGPALDAARRALPGAPPSALGPLLLGLVGVGAAPGSAWMVDWEGVTRGALAAAAAAPWRGGADAGGGGGGAAAAAPGDVASIVAAAARAGRGAPGDAWMAHAGAAAAAALPDLSDADLAALASGLHALKYRPAPDWAAAAAAEVGRRRGAAGAGEPDVEAAAAWLAALRAAG